MIAFVLYGMGLCFSHSMHFMLPNNVCILLRINFHANYALCGYFTTLLLVFCKFEDPNRFSYTENSSDVCNSFISTNYHKYQAPTLYLFNKAILEETEDAYLMSNLSIPYSIFFLLTPERHKESKKYGEWIVK